MSEQYAYGFVVALAFTACNKTMQPRTHRGIERQSGMTRHMAKRHIHRITVLNWKYLIRQSQAAIPLNEALGYRQELYRSARPVVSDKTGP